jgi:hypothetical protein
VMNNHRWLRGIASLNRGQVSKGLVGRSEGLAGAKPKDIGIALSIIVVSFRIMVNAIPPATLIWFRTHADSVEPSRTRGLRCDRASRCDEKWETAMFEIATLAAGILSGWGSMGFDAYNRRPEPTAPSRLQYALEHQPKVGPNECVVLGADYVWRACQGGRLVPVLLRR